ncbi:hypothetical protein KKC17_00510 [Patescibacteria group bacterium]|nr:hypothetical protein [Patescibacteria group bacterium]
MKIRFTPFIIVAAVILLLVGLVWFNYFVKNSAEKVKSNEAVVNQQSVATLFAEAALPVEKIYQKGLTDLTNKFRLTLAEPMDKEDLAMVEELRQGILALNVPLQEQAHHLDLMLTADKLKDELKQDKMSSDKLVEYQSKLTALLVDESD